MKKTSKHVRGRFWTLPFQCGARVHPVHARNNNRELASEENHAWSFTSPISPRTRRVLMAVLIGHMWDHYSQQADASGLEQYLAAYVISSPKDQDPYRSVEGRARAAGVQEASALDE